MVSLYSIANIARLSANVWVDVCSSDTPLTFDLWPFTLLLFINTTNHFNWFFFSSNFVCLFELFITWSLFSLILSNTLSQIVLVYHTANHKSSSDSLLKCIYGWHTLLSEPLVHMVQITGYYMQTQNKTSFLLFMKC